MERKVASAANVVSQHSTKAKDAINVAGDERHEAEVGVLKEDLRIQFALAEAMQVYPPAERNNATGGRHFFSSLPSSSPSTGAES